MRDLLVVDEEFGTRDLLQSHLGTSARVVRSSTRHDAREVLIHRSIDLVVVEARLPDSSDLELLSEIKEHNPGLPVIVVTGHGSEAICARAFKLGARDYFRKPVVAAELLRSVRQILCAPPRQAGPRLNILCPQVVSRLILPRTGNPCVDLAVRAIHERCDEKLTLGTIARTTGTGLFSLSRNFTALTGTTFRTYLIGVRVARAVELLKDRSLSIADIAEQVGFRDPSWFNKVFKRLKRVTPSAYRRHMDARNSKRAARNS